MRITTLRLAVAGAALALAAACTPAPAADSTDLTNKITDLETQNAGLKASADQLAALAAPPAADAKSVYFVNLHDGQKVKSPFRVVFGLSGVGVAPAGTEKENTGHHHLLIDSELTPEEMKFAIPNDDTHKHYGLGQTETVLTLAPGTHTLQLVLGDKGHMLMQPPIMSPKITVTVE
jgi:hypothetical protein